MGSLAGPSSWQALIRVRLEERDARERAHDDIIDNYQRLARYAKQQRDRNSSLLAAAGVTKSGVGAGAEEAAATATTGSKDALASKGTAQPSSAEIDAIRQAYTASLEGQLITAREELSSLHRTHAQNSQRLTVLGEQMSEREERVREGDEEVRKATEELARLRRRDDDLRNNIGAKDKAIEMLQDEMATLTLELSQAEARNEDLKRDNASLLQRWLDRMNTEAERMNDGNQFLRDIDRRRETTSPGADPADSALQDALADAGADPSGHSDVSALATPKGKKRAS